jgi:hypothetical protein
MQKNTLNPCSQTRCGMATCYTGVIDWEHHIHPIEETKMFKNRFILVIGVLSLVLVTMAVSNPKSNVSIAADQEASDFHQRHPDWQWAASDQKAIVPLTGEAAFPDYAQRHPELRVSLADAVDTTDYFIRLSILSAPAISVDTTDYFFRDPQLPGPSVKGADTTDYYFRQAIR